MQAITQSYTELLATHNLIDPPYTPPSLYAPARALLEHAARGGALELQGPWRLHQRACRALDRAAAITPPGGWQGLASVLAGAGVLEVREDGFHALITPEALDLWGEDELSRRLVEALTCRLVPPASAAGLFLLIGLHPAWGLRLANHVHRQLGELEDDATEQPGTIRDPRLFPAPTLRAVERAVFATISITFEIARTLEADRAYPIDLFAGVVLEACRFGRRLLERERPEPRPGELPLFIDHLTGRFGDARQRALDFTMLDLVDHFLVPIGAARRFDEQTFCVWPNALPGDARVFGQGPLEQARWLCRALTGDAACLVA